MSGRGTSKEINDRGGYFAFYKDLRFIQVDWKMVLRRKATYIIQYLYYAKLYTYIQSTR